MSGEGPPINVVEMVTAFDKSTAREFVSVCRNKFELNRFEGNDEWSHRLTIREGKTLVAFLILDVNPLLDNDKDENAVVRFVCAKEERTGYPERLLKKAEEIATSAGKKRLDLAPANATLETLYQQKYGFTTISSDKMTKPIGGLRLKKQTRRAKRNTRNHKGKKLRKLTTRRR